MEMIDSIQKKLTRFGFFTALLLSGTSVAQAQQGSGQFVGEGSDKAVIFGFKGGVNASQLYVDKVDGNTERSKWGWHAGVFLKAPVGEFFAIQPELLYTNVGTKVSYGGNNTYGIRPGEVRYNLNYVQIPLLGSITLGPISIQAGPYASYLVNANIRNLEIDDPLEGQGGRELNRDNFEKIDYGVAGGIAFDHKNLQIGARYNYGLREVSEKGLGGQFLNGSKNSNAQVFVGIGF